MMISRPARHVCLMLLVTAFLAVILFVPRALPSPRQATLPVLTQDDFNGFGRIDRFINHEEETFRVQIHPGEPIYDIRVSSFTDQTPGAIVVFPAEASEPQQVIPLEPNLRLREMIPAFFTVQDIDFDGYADIGVLADGGALWGAYEYWSYDPLTRRFVSTQATEDLKTVGFSDIIFDDAHKRVIALSMIGAVGRVRSMYQFHDDHFSLLEEVRMEHRWPAAEKSEQPFIGPPFLNCFVTMQKKQGTDLDVKTVQLPHMCDESVLISYSAYP